MCRIRYPVYSSLCNALAVCTGIVSLAAGVSIASVLALFRCGGGHCARVYAAVYLNRQMTARIMKKTTSESVFCQENKRIMKGYI